MALHCAATLVLVPVGTAPDDAAGSGAVVAAPAGAEADVVEELQALPTCTAVSAVVVPVAPEQLDAVLEHLGGHRAPGDDAAPLLLEVGDDGWALLPAFRLRVRCQVVPAALQHPARCGRSEQAVLASSTPRSAS